MESIEGDAMWLRENTDAGYVLVEHKGTIRARSKDDNHDPTMSSPLTRELAARESDEIHVALHWHPGEDALTVSVEDERAGDRFRIAVAPDQALDAFNHPFAYAA